MTDFQKRWQPNGTDSVIGKLMGFDEMRPSQKPLRGKHRVLSESYVHNVASVGIRPGSLVATGRSRSTKNVIVHEMKDKSGLQISKGKNDNIFDKCFNSSACKLKKGIRSSKHAGALVPKLLSGASCEDGRSFGENEKHCASRRVLRFLQKHEHDSLVGHLGELGIDYMKKSLEIQSEMEDKPCLFSTSISAVTRKSNLQDVKLDQNSRPGYRELRKSFKSESGKDHHQLAYKEPVVNDIASCRHSCFACTRNMSRFFQQERRTSKFKFDELSRTGYMGDKYVADEVEALVLCSPGVNDKKIYSHDPHHLLDQSSLANESRKQNFERWKTAKEVQEVGVCVRGQNLDKMLASDDNKSMPRNGLCRLSSLQPRNAGTSIPSVYSSIDVWEDGYLKSLPLFKLEAIKEALSSGKQDEDNYSKEQTILQKDILEPKGERGYEQFPGVNDTMSPSSKISESSSSYFSSSGEAYIRGVQDEIDNGFENDRCKEIELSERNPKSLISNFASQCITDATYANAEAFSIGVCTRTNDDPLLESIPAILSGESEHSSYALEFFGEEAFLNEYSEEESAYSNSSRIGPSELQDNLKRTYQQSPDSVLEQFDIQNPSMFEHFDSIGLQLQLQALNFDSEETYSEGSVMLVSGDDEDFDVRFDDLSNDGTTVKTWLGDNKSRNSSYMVDVLDEAEFCGMKSFMDFKTWYSLECPISPLVFEVLEKKYGKQASWQKSERELLFDRINSGLIIIFNPVTNLRRACATSIRSRFCASLGRDEVENELWMMLITQDKETSKDLSAKAFDKWFEIEEGFNIICGELETTLFDELMMEVASLWD